MNSLVPIASRTPTLIAASKHASTRTTQLYHRRAEKVTLDEVERIGI